MKFGKILTVLFFAPFWLFAGLAHSQTPGSQAYLTVPAVPAHAMADLFNQYGAQGWLYIGEKDDQLIFQYDGGQLSYQLDDIHQITNPQRFAAERGSQGWLFLGEEEDMAIFTRVDFPVGYHVISFEHFPRHLIGERLAELGQQGFNYLGEIEDYAVFMQVGYPLSVYATPILPEWRGILPQLMNELGAEGWQYLGEIEDRAVFRYTAAPIQYSLVGERYLPNFQSFLNQYGLEGWQYLGEEEDHFIFMR